MRDISPVRDNKSGDCNHNVKSCLKVDCRINKNAYLCAKIREQIDRIMNVANFRQKLKPWMLLIAMIIGVVFHESIHHLAFLSPYLIFVMLLVTFCRIKPEEFRIGRFIWILLAVQIFGAIAAYLAIAPYSPDIAQGAFICIFCPTATAAPVITGMLGGSVTLLATYSLISNIAVALLAPMLFSLIGGHTEIPFVDSTIAISTHVLPLILAPLIIALTLRMVAPKIHASIAARQSLSFYLWSLALIIVVGNAVSFIIKEPASRIPEMLLIALASLVVCCLQFYIGRITGKKYGDKISGAQGLGQKNTVLAIWMALTYLNPIASVGPAAYVAWQNSINSLQLYFKARADIKAGRTDDTDDSSYEDDEI